jgi:tetratricopeptide (TPR) repeat protein
MRRAAALTVLALAVLPRAGTVAAPVPSRVQGSPDNITAVTVAVMTRWVAAVQSHVPGKRDAGVEMVSGLTYDDRWDLSVSMGFFLSFLRANPLAIKTFDEERLAGMAGAIRQAPGPDAFLRRAAVLHADAALNRHRAGGHPAEPGRGGDALLPPGAFAALVSRGTLNFNRDGEILGERAMEWNWPFARALLDLIASSQPGDPFVAAWYHTTAAFMFQRGLYGETDPHLRRAAVVLPDDARILFDRAAYAEVLGLPRIQVLVSDHHALRIPDERATNDEAERLFRLALRADPSFVEARVRLGRLLGLRKRHDEAASQLATALAANPTGPVLFYAHLFAGRSAQALGKMADAAGHYKAAEALFPGAQSAGLARSQAALLESDVAGALESIRGIDKSSTARDPWRWYHLGAGRDADALLREMWAQASR